MEVSVDCPADLKAYHDRKWTGEALFNILDNAVKYSPKGGKIDIHVEGQELYLKSSQQNSIHLKKGNTGKSAWCDFQTLLQGK